LLELLLEGVLSSQLLEFLGVDLNHLLLLARLHRGRHGRHGCLQDWVLLFFLLFVVFSVQGSSSFLFILFLLVLCFPVFNVTDSQHRFQNCELGDDNVHDPFACTTL